MGLVGLCLALLVPVTVGFFILVGKSVVMNSGLFNYPAGSARALLAGTLPLRFCAARFASRDPTWRLLVPGHVARLVPAN